MSLATPYTVGGLPAGGKGPGVGGTLEPRTEINIALRLQPCSLTHAHTPSQKAARRHRHPVGCTHSGKRFSDTFLFPVSFYLWRYTPSPSDPLRHDSTPKDSGLGDGAAGCGAGRGVRGGGGRSGASTANGKLGFISRARWMKEKERR